MSNITLRELRDKVKKMDVPYTRDFNREILDSFLSDKKFSLGWRWKYIRPILTGMKEARGVVDMLLSPVRNLDNLKNRSEQRKVDRFLQDHKVIITLTTSPTRLSKITAVLATLDLTHVNRINVVLPQHYGAKQEEYGQIPDHVKKFPKVKIVRIKKDLGPITKMLPTVMKSKDKKALVLSVDDDVAYPMGMINEMIYQKVVKYPKAVLTMGIPMPFFTSIKNMRKYWPERHQKRPFVDIVEGWSSVLYTPRYVNSPCMTKIASLSKQCLLSDDFVISYVLSQMGVKRVTINNRYAFNPSPYEYGTGEDALHAGRDLGGGKKEYIPHSDDINFQKYTDCLKNVQEYVEKIKGNRKMADVCKLRTKRTRK